jgi:diguanylate cyclase
VQAILSLAHSLDMQVVAEGVEREEQVAMLRSLNCDLLQGFLWGRPQPAQFIPSLILSGAIEGLADRDCHSISSPRS